MEANSQKQKRTVLSIYAQHTRNYSGLFWGIILSSLVMQGAILAAPLYLRGFINTLATGNPSPETAHALMLILLTIIVLWLVDWAAHRIQYVLISYLQIGVMSDLYKSSFDYLLGHSYNFFVAQFAGSLSHRVSKFTRAYELLFDGIIIQLVPTLVFVVGAAVILFIRNSTLGLLLVGWAIGYAIFQIYVSHLRRPTRIARAEADSKVVGNLSDAISNQATVVLFSGAQVEASRFARTVEVWKEAVRRTWTADAWIWRESDCS